jgi:N-acyl-D-amino-acid deacylase
MFHDRAIARTLGVDLPITTEHILSYMWGRPLDFGPGQKEAYSNFGYCVLGRAIEKASGLPYERYVKERVLAPLGIRRMRLGRSALKLRAPDEVSYYFSGKAGRDLAVAGPVGERVPLPYGASNVENMDAHGGWLASAVDLVRFGSALYRPLKSGVLRPASVQRMFAPPPAPVGRDKKGRPREVYYACGWAVRRLAEGRRNTWHAGLLPGTSALLVRRWDGVCWAVLFNSSAPPRKGKQPAGEIELRLHQAVNAVKVWPRHDLFGALDKMK